MNIFMLNDSINFLVSKTSQKFKLELNRKLKKSGLDVSSDQWTVLMYLSDNNGPSQTDLAQKLYKDRANLTRILDLMEKNQLVERQRSSIDRREYNVFITEKGMSLIPQLKLIGDSVMEKALKGANAEEIIGIKHFLNKLFINLDN
ncbi:MAG: transcriptional regulator, MarR family [uncultured bacterium]|nr:MAG: transcriptional regulator, MarR family [uncultured bacterium]HBY01940.1 hypothetical protein [Rikenellaceae bacterium]